jgi:dUTP pyrophosphatase
MQDIISVPIMRLPNAKGLDLPKYATEFSAGMDLLAAIPGKVKLNPGERITIKTGIGIGLPIGYEAQVRSRSGLASKDGVIVLNSPGTIDADYRGEIMVILYNTGDKMIMISRGMRIAQLVVAPVSKVIWNDLDGLNQTSRGAGGLGSTGL